MPLTPHISRPPTNTSWTERCPPASGSPRFSRREVANAFAAEHANRLFHLLNHATCALSHAQDTGFSSPPNAPFPQDRAIPLRNHATCALPRRILGADCAFPCARHWLLVTTKRALPSRPHNSGYLSSLRPRPGGQSHSSCRLTSTELRRRGG